jgi:hypothetical protein
MKVLTFIEIKAQQDRHLLPQVISKWEKGLNTLAECHAASNSGTLTFAFKFNGHPSYPNATCYGNNVANGYLI